MISVAEDGARPRGQVYCDANPHNAADGCACSTGSLEVAMSAGPANPFGYLLVGSATGTATDPPGALGDLCLVGGPIGRY